VRRLSREFPFACSPGYSDRVRFRGYLAVHWCSGLQLPCLRFAVAVTGHHARLGTRLPARLYRGRHLRQLNFMSFQGATPTEHSVQFFRTALFRRWFTAVWLELAAPRREDAAWVAVEGTVP